MMLRSSSVASLSSTYSSDFLDGPITRSAMSDDDEYTPPPRKVGDSKSSLSVDDHSKDCCSETMSRHVTYIGRELEIPDKEILRWISLDAAPEEMPTEEQIKDGVLDRARQYFKERRESQGFDIKTFPGHGIPGIVDIMPARAFYRDYDERIEEMNSIAVLSLGENNLDKEYEFTDVLRVNVKPMYYMLYFITFHAKHLRTGVTETFQARVQESRNGHIVYFCRKASEMTS